MGIEAYILPDKPTVRMAWMSRQCQILLARMTRFCSFVCLFFKLCLMLNHLRNIFFSCA
jgi:hypothetical protein